MNNLVSWLNQISTVLLKLTIALNKVNPLYKQFVRNGSRSFETWLDLSQYEIDLTCNIQTSQRKVKWCLCRKYRQTDRQKDKQTNRQTNQSTQRLFENNFLKKYSDRTKQRAWLRDMPLYQENKHTNTTITEGRNNSVNRAPDLWSKGCEFKSQQERQYNFPLGVQLSVLTLILCPFHPGVTAVVH